MDRSRLTRRAGRAALVAAVVGIATALARPSVANAQLVAPSYGTGQHATADLLRARADVVHANAELRRLTALHARGMASDAELDARQLDFEHARAEYLRSALSVLSVGRHVVIERAVKRRLPSGAVLVRVVLGPVAPDSQLAPPTDVDGLANVLPASELRNLVVSLKSDAGANGVAISRPYERVFPRVHFGSRLTADFELLEDVPDVVIATVVADRVEERRVRLENGGTGTGLSMRAAQFSLEADLGTEVLYDITLDPSGGRVPVMRLDALGLPDGVRAEFRDGATKTRLAQVRMPEGAVAQHVQLALTLPLNAAGVRPDSLLRFAVVATAVGNEGDSVSRATAAPTARELARLELEVVGRGAGRIELQPATLFVEATPGGDVVVPIRVHNAGTRALGTIRVAGENGAQWPIRIDPSLVDRLDAGATRTVRMTIGAPRGTPVGDYEVRVSAEGDGRDRRFDVEDKLVRVRVTARSGAFGTGAVLAALALAAVGMVVFARRLVYR